MILNNHSAHKIEGFIIVIYILIVIQSVFYRVGPSPVRHFVADFYKN